MKRVAQQRTARTRFCLGVRATCYDCTAFPVEGPYLSLFAKGYKLLYLYEVENTGDG